LSSSIKANSYYKAIFSLKEGALIRGGLLYLTISFHLKSGLIRGVAFGGSGLIRKELLCMHDLISQFMFITITL
jgi:hypothetical protein